MKNKNLLLCIFGALLAQSTSVQPVPQTAINAAIVGIPTAAGAILGPVIGIIKDKYDENKSGQKKPFSPVKLLFRIFLGAGTGASFGGLFAGINHWQSKKKNKNKQPFSITPQTPQERAKKAAQLKQESAKRQQEIKERFDQRKQVADKAKRDKELQEIEALKPKLVQALDADDPQIIEQLKKQNFNFNAGMDYKEKGNGYKRTWPLLTQIIDRGSSKMLEKLLTDPAIKLDLNAGDDWFCPLSLAIDQGNLTAAQLLLEAGAHPDYCSKKGVSPLVWALCRRNAAAVDLLVKYGLKLNNVDKISYALLKKDIAAIDQLFGDEKQRIAGAQDMINGITDQQVIDAEFNRVVTMFFDRIEELDNPADQKQFLDILLKYGLDTNTITRDILNQNQPYFILLIHRLARSLAKKSIDNSNAKKYESAIKLLIEKGVDCNLRFTDDETVFTARNKKIITVPNPSGLQIAVAGKCFEIADLMLQHGAQANDLALPELQQKLIGIDATTYPLLAQCINP